LSSDCEDNAPAPEQINQLKINQSIH